MPEEKYATPPVGKLILVVDDEESVAELIARALDEQGHEVDAVLSPEAAWEN